jgi:hypothetical protein
VHLFRVGPASALLVVERPRECGSSECYNPWRHAAGEVEVRGLYLGCWRNGLKRPVLKHGPRSLTSMRVFGCQARPRNESERRREPCWRTVDRSGGLPKDLSKSIAVGTRKMVNYA